jgi:hypothetical protein
MTPEQAQQENLIDGIILGDADSNILPPSTYKQLQEAGFVDRLSGDVLRLGYQRGE